MLEREIRLGKSLTVRALTTCSLNLSGSTVAVSSSSNWVSPTGGMALHRPIIITDAISPVTTNTISIHSRIFPKRRKLTIEAMEELMEKNTIGTTRVKIRFKNTSPNGFNTTAFSPAITPITQPTAIDASRMSGNRYDFRTLCLVI